MDRVDAYEFLNTQFIRLAEEKGRSIAPVFGRRRGVVEYGEPPYSEISGDRWFSIYPETGQIDAQWNGLEPAHLQVFVDLDIHCIDLLWRLRCAWFNFDVDTVQAELDVRGVVTEARGKCPLSTQNGH